MIYSAKVLEIHYNICSVEADTEAEARQKFLSSVISSDDCLGSGFVSTAAIVEVRYICPPCGRHAAGRWADEKRPAGEG